MHYNAKKLEEKKFEMIHKMVQYLKTLGERGEKGQQTALFLFRQINGAYAIDNSLALFLIVFLL